MGHLSCELFQMPILAAPSFTDKPPGLALPHTFMPTYSSGSIPVVTLKSSGAIGASLTEWSSARFCASLLSPDESVARVGRAEILGWNQEFSARPQSESFILSIL
jgi:hypothetical protein